MKFLLDHDVPEDLTYLLQELGHEVLRLRDVLPQDASDPVVLQCSHQHRCLLVTCNRDDFIELAQRQPYHGIVVIIRRRTRAAERAALFRLLERTLKMGSRAISTLRDVAALVAAHGRITHGCHDSDDRRRDDGCSRRTSCAANL